MNAASKLLAYAVTLGVIGALAVGVGNAVGPIGSADGAVPPANAHADEHADGPAGQQAMTRPRRDGAAPASTGDPGGLMMSEHGFTLDLADRSVSADAESVVRFRVLGPDGAPVTDYERTHDKDLHLIVVRRDMVAFQHVHPVLDEQGTWRAALDLSRPGTYRVFADFTPQGSADATTLGADLHVAGTYDPRPLPEPSRHAQVDGYDVDLDGTLVPGRQSKLTLTVTRDGEPVTDLQPYLGAYGHLVVLRDGDLSYLHVHPAGEPGDGATEPGPGITFYATTPAAGDYRLFLDFRHDDVVRTAEFTVAARNHTQPADLLDTPSPSGHGSTGHGH